MQDSVNSDNSVYRMLFDNAGDAIFVHNKDKILAVNEKACESLGYTENELLSMMPNQVDSSEQRMYMPERMEKLKSQKIINFETTHLKKDGTQFNVEVTSKSIKWDGEPAIISICRDNTKKKHYDNIVLNAAFEWQYTFDSINDAVFLLSQDQRILRCNKASYLFFNKTPPGQIIGKRCWEVVHGTSEPMPTCPVIKMKKTRKRESSVLKYGDRWLEVTADPFLDENNNISGAVHIISDITERKRMEDILSSSEEKYHKLHDSMIDAFILVDMDGRIREMNRSFKELLGYSEEELLALTYKDLTPSKWHEFEKGILTNQILVKGYSEIYEKEYRRKDGRVIPVELRTSIIRDANGVPLGMWAIVRDLTERKRNEMLLKMYQEHLEEIVEERTTALRESEKKYRELVENTNSIILRMDKTGKVTFFNEFAQSFFGFTTDEIIGKNVIGTIFPRKDSFGQDMKEMILDIGKKTGKYRNNVNENLRKDGERVWIAWTNKTIFDESGHVIEIMCIGNDITGRVKAEKELEKYRNSLEELVKERTEALMESQKQYRNLVEGTSDLVTRVSADGHFLFVNHAAQEIYGLSPEECIGRLAFDLIHPEDRESTMKAFQTWLEGGKEVFSHENRMIDSSGQTHYLEWSIRSEHDENGNISGFASTARDVTDTRKAEEERVKLEERNRQLQKSESLERMAGAISHHFNNQLHVVMGYLGMAIGDLPPDNSCVTKLSKALHAARKASEVSSLLLAYLGQIPGKLEMIDLAEICRMSLPILQAGKPKNVKFETDFPFTGPCISADPKQIQHLLTNLTINAWEAIGDKPGTIFLRVGTVFHTDIPKSHRFPVGWHPKEYPYACLEVVDSGCGIREDDVEKIFDPFFSTKFTGRGLGLSTVLGIVRTHESVITEESGENGGSVFKVFFPIPEQKASVQAETIAQVPQTGYGGTVLLVEDEDGVRRMTEIVLMELGFTVLPAKDGVEAVETFKKHKAEISCLLCDLTMPRMGGWETISALRAIRQDLPVILASGYDEATVMAGEHPDLPDFFLNKPYDLYKLGDTIGHAIARKKSS